MRSVHLIIAVRSTLNRGLFAALVLSVVFVYGVCNLAHHASMILPGHHADVDVFFCPWTCNQLDARASGRLLRPSALKPCVKCSHVVSAQKGVQFRAVVVLHLTVAVSGGLSRVSAHANVAISGTDGNRVSVRELMLLMVPEILFV